MENSKRRKNLPQTRVHRMSNCSLKGMHRMILKAPGLSVTQQLLVVDDRANLGDGQNPF